MARGSGSRIGIAVLVFVLVSLASVLPSTFVAEKISCWGEGDTAAPPSPRYCALGALYGFVIAPFIGLLAAGLLWFVPRAPPAPGASARALATSGHVHHPILTFDGSTAIYRGPSRLGTGRVTFLLANYSEVAIGFVWGLHDGDGVTLEDEIAWANTNSTPPPWVVDGGDIGEVVPPGAVATGSTGLPPGRLSLVAWDGAAQKGYVAAIADVESD